MGSVSSLFQSNQTWKGDFVADTHRTISVPNQGINTTGPRETELFQLCPCGIRKRQVEIRDLVISAEYRPRTS